MNVKRSILSPACGFGGGRRAAFVAWPVARSRLFADSLNCNLSQYKAAQGLTAAVEQDALRRVVGRPERRRSARAVRDRQRPAIGPGTRGQESRRAMGHARQEPRAGISRRHRHSPDGRRSGEPVEGGGYRADRRGDQQEPVVRVLGCAARDAGVAGNAGRSGMAPVSAASTGPRRRAWRTWPGSGSRLADPQPDAGHAADAVRDSARRRVVPHHVVQREDRRREPRS